ncbi:hypothetical protein [Mycobacterium sp. NPDC006124]|uniref:hypothetical protein n=1 Tax=Mycobacterium sp. NPDC006124 TaxID=3156729 RepID=UPI0033AEAA3B
MFGADFLDGRSLNLAHHIIEEYVATAGRTRDGAVVRDRTQQGDPVTAAAAIVENAPTLGCGYRSGGRGSRDRIQTRPIAADLDAIRLVAASTGFQSPAHRTCDHRSSNALTARTRSLLDAAVGLLTKSGLAAAITDAVSARMGGELHHDVQPWPNRLAAAVEEFARQMTNTVTAPHTGSTEGGLDDRTGIIAQFYATPQGHTYADLLAAAVTDPVDAELLPVQFLANGVNRSSRRGTEKSIAVTSTRPEFKPSTTRSSDPIIVRLVSGACATGSRRGRPDR